MDSKWTAERDAEAVKILTDDSSVNKDRRYYHVREKFDLIEVDERPTSATETRSTYYGSNRQFP